MIAVATPITACFIRLANLMNSEIIGKVTDVSWAFVFERVDMQPRHPAQLYEAIAYFILFLVMMFLYKNYSKKLHRGFFFGLCLTAIFTFRFCAVMSWAICWPFMALSQLMQIKTQLQAETPKRMPFSYDYLYFQEPQP